MREEAREIRQALLDRLRAENARAPKSVERAALEAELETAGIDTTEFGLFHDFGLTTFDYEAAAPILVEWLPRVREPADTEVIARSLTGTKSAAAAAAREAIDDDDDIAGHAILALRSYGPKSALPHLRRARPKFEAVLARPTATVFAKRQARKALERLHA